MLLERDGAPARGEPAREQTPSATGIKRRQKNRGKAGRQGYARGLGDLGEHGGGKVRRVVVAGRGQGARSCSPVRSAHLCRSVPSSAWAPSRRPLTRTRCPEPKNRTPLGLPSQSTRSRQRTSTPASRPPPPARPSSRPPLRRRTPPQPSTLVPVDSSPPPPPLPAATHRPPPACQQSMRVHQTVMLGAGGVGKSALTSVSHPPLLARARSVLGS